MKCDAGALNMKTDDGTPEAPALASLSCYSCADNASGIFKSSGEHDHTKTHTHTLDLFLLDDVGRCLPISGIRNNFHCTSTMHDINMCTTYVTLSWAYCS